MVGDARTGSNPRGVLHSDALLARSGRGRLRRRPLVEDVVDLNDVQNHVGQLVVEAAADLALVAQPRLHVHHGAVDLGEVGPVLAEQVLGVLQEVVVLRDGRVEFAVLDHLVEQPRLHVLHLVRKVVDVLARYLYERVLRGAEVSVPGVDVRLDGLRDGRTL